MKLMLNPTKYAAWHCENFEAFFKDEKLRGGGMKLRHQICIPSRLHHRATLFLMLIYIALNIAVIPTEMHITKANEVGFNQSVTRIDFSEIRTNETNAHELRGRKTPKTSSRRRGNDCRCVDQTCCRGNLIPLTFFCEQHWEWWTDCQYYRSIANLHQLISWLPRRGGHRLVGTDINMQQ